MTLIAIRQLPELQQDLPTDVAESLTLLKSNADYTVAIASLRLEDLYRMTAVVSFLNDANIAAFHTNMFMAAAVRRRFLTCVERGMKADPGFLFATYDKSIYEALCAGEPTVLDDLARSELTLEADLKLDNPYYYHFALTLRLLIVGAIPNAKQTIDTFDEERAGALEGHSLMAHGMLEKNQKLFTKGLKIALEQRKVQIANDEQVFVGEQWLAVECLALTRLGRVFGLKAGVKDSLIPEELQGAPEVRFPDAKAILPPIPGDFVVLPKDYDEDANNDDDDEDDD